LELDPLDINTKASLAPVFSPPGFLVASTPPSTQGSLQLDLVLRTRPENTASSEIAKVTADLHLAGTLASPQVGGTLSFNNQTLQLPAGAFFVPSATLSFDHGNAGWSGTAYGITRVGLMALSLAGSPKKPEVVAETPSVTEASAVYSCLMTKTASSAAPVIQAPYWLRQEQILPTPSIGWAAPAGEAIPAGLGFMNAPWIWSLHIGETNKL
jgi:hypothetical protein